MCHKNYLIIIKYPNPLTESFLMESICQKLHISLNQKYLDQFFMCGKCLAYGHKTTSCLEKKTNPCCPNFCKAIPSDVPPEKETLSKLIPKPQEDQIKFEDDTIKHLVMVEDLIQFITAIMSNTLSLQREIITDKIKIQASPLLKS